MPAEPRFERVRATRCRRAYKVVRGVGYLVMFSGIGLVVADSVRGGSTAEQWSMLRSAGMLCVLSAFMIFVASYGLYIAVRMIEAKIVKRTGEGSGT